MLEKLGTLEREPDYMTKPSSLRKRMSENAEPLTEGAQSQTASVLAVLIEQHCHLSLGNYTYGIF